MTAGPQMLALDVSELLRAAREADPESMAMSFEEGLAPPELEGTWIGRDGESLGDSFPLGSIQPQLVESFDGSGQIGWQSDTADLALALEFPADAQALELSIGGAPLTRLEAGAVSARISALPPPVRERIGPAQASFSVQIVAERFGDLSRFRSFVAEARRWAMDCPPFDDAAIANEIAYDLLFWPSDLANGNFATPDSGLIDGRLFYGNRELARQLLAPYLNPRFPSIILVNSGVRGGAGGSAAYSAWASIGSSDWQAVCLHELGHSFGLADEYLDARRAHERPNGEPNVSIQKVAGLSPWRASITVPAAAAPSHAANQQGPSTAAAIGTFAGARYRTDLYRPMRDCLMRSTATAKFCAVCAEVIRKSLVR